LEEVFHIHQSHSDLDKETQFGPMLSLSEPLGHRV
jgi:hypothetical protein